jgi:uncharacterized protein (TIGR00730 family)
MDVAVFGSSEPVEGEPLYLLARNLGRVLAAQGHTVVTGGYGGIMEAASRGAREAGGRTVGVLCDTFSSRSPNRYVTEPVGSADLFERTRILIDRSDAFVVLRGKAGTLAELSFLWALHRAGCLERRPVVLLGDHWRPFLDHLDGNGLLDEEQFAVTRLAGGPEEVAEILNGFRPGKGR